LTFRGGGDFLERGLIELYSNIQRLCEGSLEGLKLKKREISGNKVDALQRHVEHTEQWEVQSDLQVDSGRTEKECTISGE